MTELQHAASRWLAIADDLGWGVEGPVGADDVQVVMEALSAGTDPAEVAAVTEDRDLGTRPVDALFQAAQLLTEAFLTDGPQRRAELISSARGWMQMASRR